MAERSRGTVTLPGAENEQPRVVHWDTFMLLHRLALGFRDLSETLQARSHFPVTPPIFKQAWHWIRKRLARVYSGGLNQPKPREQNVSDPPINAQESLEIRRKLDQIGGLGGLALSGGGIRSATLSLGVMQAVAMRARRDLPPNPPKAAPVAARPQVTSEPPMDFKNSLLAEFGYLSTVSGGGYFGSFLCSLFIPNRLTDKNGNLLQAAATAAANDALRVLQKEPPGRVRAVRGLTASKQKPSAIPPVTVFAPPNQASDELTSAPLAWLRDNGRYLTPTGAGDAFYAGSLAVRNLLSVHYVIGSGLLGACAAFALVEALFSAVRGGELIAGGLLNGWWIGPGFALASLVFLGWSIPAGAAFWIPYPADNKGRSNILNAACQGFIGTAIVFAFVALYSSRGASPSLFWNGWPWWYGTAVAGVAATMYLGSRACSADVIKLRTMITHSLTLSLQIVCLLLALATIDSISHTLYVLLTQQTESTPGRAAGIATPAAAAGALIWIVRKLALATGGNDTPALLKKVPWQWLAGAAGLAVLGLMAIFWGLLAVALIWQGHPLADTNRSAGPVASVVGTLSTQEVAPTKLIVTVAVTSNAASSASPTFRLVPVTVPVIAAALLAGVSLLITFVIGRFPSFINLSSLQSFYAARLTRAYLGASNGKRFEDLGQPTPTKRKRASAAEPISSDQVWLDQFVSDDKLKTYAPLHLINTTMNNTDAPGEQLVQRDRKGQPVVTTPFGFSIDGEGPYAFRADNGGYEIDRTLNIGQWTGISGAAVSTGLGRQSSLGLSLLLGTANVRLGAWWKSNIGVTAPNRVSRLVNWLCPTQSYLFNEFTSKFHGLARQYQYLTDGGHFENTGVYELLRPERCVKFILACDNGADRDYLFGDLANLTRLVRIDLQIELKVEEGAAKDPALQQWFGIPEDFRKAETERRNVDKNCKCVAAAPRPEPVAVLLRATRGPLRKTQTWIVLLKPRVRSDSAADVIHYAATHSTFPQEATGDQFFDEAQWESYRKLAYDNATAVLKDSAWTALETYIASHP